MAERVFIDAEAAGIRLAIRVRGRWVEPPDFLLTIGPFHRCEEREMADVSVSVPPGGWFPITGEVAKDANGNVLPALGGPVKITGSDDAVVVVTDRGDGTGFVVAKADGTAVVTVTDGVAEAHIDVTVTTPLGPETELDVTIGAVETTAPPTS